MRQGIRVDTAKRIEVLNGVVDTYEDGEYPLHEILKTVPMAEATFLAWLRGEQPEIKDIKDRYKKAQFNITKDKIENMVPRVVSNLQRMADGFEYEEEETIYTTDKKGKPIVKQKKVVKKRMPPSLGANIFIAKNADPNLFKDAFNHEVSHNLPRGINYSNLTEEQQRVLEEIARNEE